MDHLDQDRLELLGAWSHRVAVQLVLNTGATDSTAGCDAQKETAQLQAQGYKIVPGPVSLPQVEHLFDDVKRRYVCQRLQLVEDPEIPFQPLHPRDLLKPIQRQTRIRVRIPTHRHPFDYYAYLLAPNPQFESGSLRE